jgi:hypothetical protein
MGEEGIIPFPDIEFLFGRWPPPKKKVYKGK